MQNEDNRLFLPSNLSKIECRANIVKVREALHELYDEYVVVIASNGSENNGEIETSISNYIMILSFSHVNDLVEMVRACLMLSWKVETWIVLFVDI